MLGVLADVGGTFSANVGFVFEVGEAGEVAVFVIAGVIDVNADGKGFVGGGFAVGKGVGGFHFDAADVVSCVGGKA